MISMARPMLFFWDCVNKFSVLDKVKEKASAVDGYSLSFPLVLVS